MTVLAADIHKHVRTYMMVFFALMVLTVVTVAISYLRLSFGAAVTLALVVAVVKGSLVALVFMHLIDERKLVYAVLAVTVLFFAVMMAIPLLGEWDTVGDRPKHGPPATTQPAHH